MKEAKLVTVLIAVACATPSRLGVSSCTKGVLHVNSASCTTSPDLGPFYWQTSRNAVVLRLRGGSAEKEQVVLAAEEEDVVDWVKDEEEAFKYLSSSKAGDKCARLDLHTATVEELQAEMDRLIEKEMGKGASKDEAVLRAQREFGSLYQDSEVVWDEAERQEEELQRQWQNEWEAERAAYTLQDEAGNETLMDEGVVRTLQEMMLENQKNMDFNDALMNLDELDKAIRPADPEAGAGVGGATPGDLMLRYRNSTELNKKLESTMRRLDSKVKQLEKEVEEKLKRKQEEKAAEELEENVLVEQSLAQEAKDRCRENLARAPVEEDESVEDDEQQWRDAVYVLTGKSGDNVTKMDLPAEVRARARGMPKPDMGMVLEEMGEWGDFLGAVPTPSLESFEDRYLSGVKEKIQESRRVREEVLEQQRRANQRMEGEDDAEEEETKVSPYIMYQEEGAERPAVFYDKDRPDVLERDEELKDAVYVNMTMQEELFDAAEVGDYRKVLSLIGRGAKPDPCSPSVYTRSALHWAAFGGHAKTVEVLVDHGSQIDLQDAVSGCTPLHFACNNGHADAVQELLRKGANPDAQDHSGRTALHVACVSGGADMVGMLIEAGANIEIKDRMEATPLHVACYWGNPHATLRLLHAGANLNAKNMFNFSPLQSASTANHTHITDIISEHKNCRDANCWEASSLAKSFQSQDEDFLNEIRAIDRKDYSEFAKEVIQQDEHSLKVKEFRERWMKTHNDKEMKWFME